MMMKLQALFLFTSIRRILADCDFSPAVSSVALGTIPVSDDACLTEEGCLDPDPTLASIDVRNVLRFTTTIYNVGTTDCVVGSVPSCPASGTTPSDNGPFHFSQCHRHWHVQGYADYTLRTPPSGTTCAKLATSSSAWTSSTVAATGHKNGFCLMDIGCRGGKKTYTCSNMGVATNCYDEYVSSLGCQWIDVTKVMLTPANLSTNYCLCIQVNADPNYNIGGEVNFANNRVCTDVVLSRTRKYGGSNRAPNPNYVCKSWNP